MDTNIPENGKGSNPTEETQTFRPQMSPAIVTQLARDLYGLHVLSCRELDSYDDRNFHVTVDPSNVCNAHVTELCPHGYVLKVLNAQDSKRPEVTEAKNAMMVEAAKRGIPTPRILQSVTGQLCCLQSLAKEDADQPSADVGSPRQQDVYLIRVMEYLPGVTLANVTLTPQLCFQVGHFAARLDMAFKDFDDSKFPELIVDWNMQNIPSLGRLLLRFISDAEKAKVVTDVIEAFDKRVMKRESGLQTGLIHSDLNDHNILVGPMTNGSSTASTPSSPPSPSSAPISPTTTDPSAVCICGIIDYGDSTKSFLLIEVAIAMNYMTLLCPTDSDPDEMAAHTLAGYLSEMELSVEEVELIPLTMCARFAQTLITGFQRLALDPSNEYSQVHANKAWPHLCRLWTRPLADTLRIWKRVSDSLGVAFPARE